MVLSMVTICIPSHWAQMSPNIGMSLKTMVTISNTSHVSTALAPSLIFWATDLGIIWLSSSSLLFISWSSFTMDSSISFVFSTSAVRASFSSLDCWEEARSRSREKSCMDRSQMKRPEEAADRLAVVR